MGVPVVVLAGGNFVARMGASFMRALGRSDWVATDEAGYVETAARLARDCVELRRSRGILREQMKASPLCDIGAYVRDFEALLQRMWAVYCAGERPRVLRAGDEGDDPSADATAAQTGTPASRLRSGIGI